MKARLDIKVAIYKEPARVSARARTRISSIIRISMYTHTCAHISIHIHVYMYTQTRAEEARERGPRGGTGRLYLHIESVS